VTAFSDTFSNQFFDPFPTPGFSGTPMFSGGFQNLTFPIPASLQTFPPLATKFFSTTLPAADPAHINAPAAESSSFFCQNANLSGFLGSGGAAECLAFTPRPLPGNPTVTTACFNIGIAFSFRIRYDVYVKYTYCATPAIANPDSAETCAGMPVVINVLNNDTINGAPIPAGSCAGVNITIVPASGPTRGILTPTACLAGNNTPCAGFCLTYTPNAGQPPTNAPVLDTFRYTIRDPANPGCLSNEACVRIVLHPLPNLVADTYDICQGSCIVFDVLSNDVLAPAAALTVPAGCTGAGTLNVPAATFDCNTLTVVGAPPTGLSRGANCAAAGCTLAPGTHPCAGRCFNYTPGARERGR
jgi:hypothetical protein